AVAGLACMATSQLPGTYLTDAYIVNASDIPVDLRVRRVDAKLDCEAIMAGDPTRMLGPDAFTLGTTYHLEPYDTMPLQRGALDPFGGGGGVGGTGAADPGNACEVV